MPKTIARARWCGRFATVCLLACLLGACANRATPEQLGAIRTIALATDIEETVYRQSLGMMIFSNDYSEYDAQAWGIQQRIRDEAQRQLSPRFAVVPVDVEPWREKDDRTRGRRDYVSPLPDRARQAVERAGAPVDAVLLIATDSTRNVMSSSAIAPALSVYSRNASGLATFFDDMKHSWAILSLRAELFDLRTGEVIDFCWVGGVEDHGVAQHLPADLYQDTMQDYTPEQVDQLRTVFQAMAVQAAAKVLACSLVPGAA
ncbi:hypothetical protein [Zavarzinia sp. CC-PAN008]|uniref:hypothetical protein n=1 Tax=Zavarzinia sp. CC-PAN008 TaxID=3243332 RepID=UPI003F7447C6